MADEMVYRPRELKRRHDEVVVDRQQIQILKELENNAEGKSPRTGNATEVSGSRRDP